MPLPAPHRPFRDLAAEDLTCVCTDWLYSTPGDARADRVRALLRLAQAASPGSRVAVCPSDWELLRRIGRVV